MKNRDYWNERFAILNENLLKPAEELVPHIENAYATAIINIEKKIEAFYRRFASDNKITLREAMRKLSPTEQNRFRIEVNDYIKKASENNLDSRWVKKLKNAGIANSIDRLTALQMQMRQQIEVLEAYKANGITKTLGELYKDGYYTTAYEIQKGLGVGTAFATLDVNGINKVLAKPWAPDGRNFSERIWGTDRSNLVYQLNTRLTQGIIRGESQQKISKDIAKALNASKTAAGRLVHTESAAFSSISRNDSYKALGASEFEFIVALDESTCEQCGGMDGMHLPLEKYEIGITAPPLHPWCRCTTAPYFNDEFTQGEERAARGEDGKTYYVPTDMSFEQWKNTLIENNMNGELKHSFKNDRLSDGEITAIKDYISAKSYALNEKLRNGVELSKNEEILALNLSNALKKLPKYNGTVYRSLSEFGIDDIKEFLNLHIQGEYVCFSQFLSTGVEVYDENFPIQYIIKSKTGRDIRDFNAAESEVLFDRDSLFLIEKVETNVIYLKEA